MAEPVTDIPVSGYPRVTGPDAATDPALGQLLAQLQARHHGAICATLLYGSCLRSGDIYDGLLDLYLVCDDYRAAYRSTLLATANWLLPPNVFYAESTLGGRTLRSKVTVISLADFRRGCSRAWFESYIWGRFAQPTLILHSRDAHNSPAGRELPAAGRPHPASQQPAGAAAGGRCHQPVGAGTGPELLHRTAHGAHGASHAARQVRGRILRRGDDAPRPLAWPRLYGVS